MSVIGGVQPDTVAPGEGRDPFVFAFPRHLEALDRRYPGGPDQMCKENLDARGNMPRMRKSGNGSAA